MPSFSHEFEDILSFWGKASPSDRENSVKTHPLLAHSLDVAAVAVCLAQASLSKENKDILGLDPQQIGFLVALHDIGKLMPGFQAKVPEAFPAHILGDISHVGNSGRHTSDGLTLLVELSEDFEPFEDFISTCRFSFGIILSAIAGHHGRPVEKTRFDRDDFKEDFSRAERFIAVLLDIFSPKPLPKLSDNVMRLLGWRLAQITLLSDWIGSRQEWFPYVQKEELYDPRAYFENACLKAQEALLKSGLSPAQSKPFTTISTLFPHIKMPSPLQKLLGEVMLPSGPCLAIIEDMTGSGKTEAALLLAQRMMEEKSLEGLFVALPTMATANAIYGRLQVAYRRLFTPDSRPSLALTHGKARFEDGFLETIHSDDARNIREFYGIGGQREDDNISAEAFCSEWLGSETRRSLLAHIGVGTIDQALLSVLPVRFATLRQAGLARKVLIIDECHAFDAYMTQEMQALLRFHAAMGGSAILLSATLTKTIREQLIKAFRQGLGNKEEVHVKNEAYPLVSLASKETIEEIPCAPREGLSRSVPVRRIGDCEAVLKEIEVASQQKAGIVWIRNTVDDVVAAARLLKEKNIPIKVFHARFAMGDRLEIEKEILKKFGKESWGEERASVLVASQVVEQSLDLDFDLLCTDLAPMDLLIQRVGRLWRHHRSERVLKKPEFLVLSPEAVTEPSADWIKSFLPGTAAVYGDPSLLWRTAKILFERGEIRTPEDSRFLIEDAGNSDDMPASFEEAFNKGLGKKYSDESHARQNVLSPFGSYKDGHDLWENDVKTPTRLQDDVRVVVRLAIEKNGVIFPWYLRDKACLPQERDALRRAWALSEVSVSQNRLSACPPSEGLEESIKQARETWSRFERDDEEFHLLLVLKKRESIEKEEWEGLGVRKSEEDIKIIYSLVYGLEFISGAV